MLRASIAIMETMATTDTSSDLKARDLATLLRHGDCDPSAPLERTGMRTAALLPNAELKVYERAPHGLPLTHADRVAADVLRFITARAAVGRHGWPLDVASPGEHAGRATAD